MSNSRKTVRIPTNITTGTNILKLDPGFYTYEDSNASDQDKMNMGFPKSFWHSHIIVRGYWANEDKTNGYIEILVTDLVTEAKIYNRNLLGDLYRENPVKSRNYEAVKSSKKWENVGNSYIIPALLLYRYSYI